jgi:hypothetical protein
MLVVNQGYSYFNISFTIYTGRNKPHNSPGCRTYCVVNFFHIFVCDVLARSRKATQMKLHLTASITTWIQE